MSTVRAKFRCDYVEDCKHSMNGDGHYIYMTAVYSDDPASENKKFTDATPDGSFRMRITVPATATFFEVGQEYYLDITKAPAA